MEPMLFPEESRVTHAQTEVLLTSQMRSGINTSADVQRTSRYAADQTMVHLSGPRLCRLSFAVLWTTLGVLSQRVNNFQSSGTIGNGLSSSYFFYQQPDYPKDCREIQFQCATSNRSGVHLIKPQGLPEPFEVYCDNDADTGGWTVIQRRLDGSLDFNRNWTEYEIGFGFLSQEFWLGNKKLSFLTNQDNYELRTDVTYDNGMSFYVTYSKFRISDDYSDYQLFSVGEYSGEEGNLNAFFCPPRTEGVIYTSPDCSNQCSCTSGMFTCDAYQCSINAVCEERGGLRQCYCRTGYSGDGVNCTTEFIPSDCLGVFNRISTQNGVYKIKPTGWTGEPFDVYCNMSDGGGWTVFQRRVDGSVEFNIYWSDYKEGFGSPSHEFWLGNDKLHILTNQRNYELRIDLVDRYGVPYYAKYNLFSIRDENNNYRLTLGAYSEGTAGDSLSYNNGRAFTTRDRDNDGHSSYNCATEYYCNCGSEVYQGPWWYHYCSYVALNNRYGGCCLEWRQLPDNHYIRYTEMKLRPI